MGAGIEIVDRLIGGFGYVVAPFVGAGIEM